MLETIKHGKPPIRPVRYTDEEWAHIRDGIVVGTADIVVINDRNQVLMMPRAYEPAKGFPYIIGGRMNFGESPEEAAARGFKREMGLNLPLDRFKMFKTYNLIWEIRDLPPVENGYHTLSNTHLVFLSDREIAQLKPNEEYAGDMIWRRAEEIANSSTDLEAMTKLAKDLIEEGFFLR